MKPNIEAPSPATFKGSTTIHDILEGLRREASSNRDLGDKFERLIAGYLKTVPLQRMGEHL